jgi:HlyD family secretion protein
VKRIATTLVLVIAAGAGVAYWMLHRHEPAGDLVLYGNVDFRQVELAFHGSERIESVAAEEGDRVHRGQVVARLDTSRLTPEVAQADAQVAASRHALERLRNGSRPEEIAQARAQVAAQQEVVDRLHHGSRPEEIAQARANVESAKADVLNTRRRFERVGRLIESKTVTKDDFDAAKAAWDVAEARLVVSQKALDLALAGPRAEDIAEAESRLNATQQALDLTIAGPRKEDIAQAEAQLRATEAQAALVRQRLADAQLIAPAEAIVRSRIMEPGEMASPQKPVFSLAIIDPKWVRAYATEPELGHLRSGMKASVRVDSFPDRHFEGWIGFISPVAEFTPKTVQTEELRTSLVFEVRVFVKDPSDELRLGMPATVHLVNDASTSTASEAR